MEGAGQCHYKCVLYDVNLYQLNLCNLRLLRFLMMTTERQMSDGFLRWARQRMQGSTHWSATAQFLERSWKNSSWKALPFLGKNKKVTGNSPIRQMYLGQMVLNQLDYFLQ